MLLLALALAQVSADQIANLSVDARYDLTCVEATSWAMVSVGKTDSGYSTYVDLNMFYLGRLTGRDDATHWIDVYNADMARNKRPDKYYADAVASRAGRASEKLSSSYHARWRCQSNVAANVERC